MKLLSFYSAVPISRIHFLSSIVLFLQLLSSLLLKSWRLSANVARSVSVFSLHLGWRFSGRCRTRLKDYSSLHLISFIILVNSAGEHLAMVCVCHSGRTWIVILIHSIRCSLLRGCKSLRSFEIVSDAFLFKHVLTTLTGKIVLIRFCNLLSLCCLFLKIHLLMISKSNWLKVQLSILAIESPVG